MILKRLSFLLAFILVAFPLRAQDNKGVEHHSSDGRYTWHTVAGDPLGARVYVLKNGLTVMMSVNKTTPRIQTLIATKAGSKNDPADHTGLAHYLEHMLFKGSDMFGTKDWTAESPLITEIENLYEEYNHTTDPAKRKMIYHAIDSVSGVAAGYAIPNEYDKLLGSIGAQGTNAFTSVEQTVYMNDIPSNQLDKWLQIEAERFRAPVFRLFHTELEAVYEEKNISLDNDDNKVYEQGNAALFHNHAYGTQTTIGTIEHLKNPSLQAIRKYYQTYYVPNNMGIIIAGDFDPDRAIEMIDQRFGSFPASASVPVYTFKPEVPRTAPEVVNIVGPDAEGMRIGYRFPGAGTRDALLLELTDLLLAYKGSGLIDINLKQQQKVLDASSGPSIMKDYSVHWFTGQPKEGQTLEEVRDLLLAQIEKIKKGEFDETTLHAVIRNLKVDQIQQNESNPGRAFVMLDAFTLGESWGNHAHKLDMMAKFTKQEVVEFARKYYGNDYVVVYKRTGEPEGIAKVEKPEITPIPLNRADVSPFVQKILATPAAEMQPVFVDYARDINRLALSNGTEVLSLPNTENDLFQLYYVFDMGKRNDLKLPIAIKYLKYLGTNTKSAEQLSKEFFNLGCQFNISSGEEQVSVSLTGLRESFEPALQLFENLLANAKPDQKALDNLVAQELKIRSDEKLDKRRILYGGLYSYLIYGKDNPFTYRLSEKELKGLKGGDLVAYIKSLTGYRHRVLYYGPTSGTELVATLNRDHRMPATLRDYPPAKKFTRSNTGNMVYFVNFPGMVQSEILWLNKQGTFDAKMVPVVSLFNQYYGGDMSSVVFQTIRESKALAYSTFASYDIPNRKDDPFYVMAYVGTQADKLPDALPAMNTILKDMPQDERSFVQAREALRNRLQTERITRADILFDYLGALKLGVDHDLRRDTYNALDKMTLEDLHRFHDERFNNSNYTFGVLGASDHINLKDLGKYGKVQELSLKELFGY